MQLSDYDLEVNLQNIIDDSKAVFYNVIHKHVPVPVVQVQVPLLGMQVQAMSRPPSEHVAWPTPQGQQYTSCWPLDTSRHAWTLGGDATHAPKESPDMIAEEIFEQGAWLGSRDLDER